MTKFIKYIFISFVVMAAVLTVSTANATEVRVGTMGGVGFYTHDNSNIFYFPGAIYSYNGQVYGELRVKNTDNSYTIGVNYPLGTNAVVGAYLNRPLPLAVKPGIVNNVTLNQSTDLFYGRQMSQFDLGLKLSLGLDSYKQDLGTDELKESARYLALGAGVSNEGMDLAAIVELPHASHDSATVSNTWGGFGFGVIGRLFHGDNTKLVPLVAFNYRKTSSKFKPGTTQIDYTDMNVGLGVGLNHQINEDNLMVAGLELFGLQSSKEKSSNFPLANGEITDSRITLPGLYMGVESKIKSWLTGRLGAAQVWQNTKHKISPTGGTSTESSARTSQYNVSFGLGFNFGDFDIDAAINEGLFFDGPNFISGTNEPLATRLAVIYNF
jgi:hypothetical protein